MGAATTVQEVREWRERSSPGGRADHPERSNHDHGVCVDADSLLPDWDGTPPDYDAAAHVLLDATSPRKPHVERDAPAAEPFPRKPPNTKPHGPPPPPTPETPLRDPQPVRDAAGVSTLRG